MVTKLGSETSGQPEGGEQSVKDQLKEKLKNTGAISSSDVQSTADNKPEVEEGWEPDKDDTSKAVDKNVGENPVITSAASASSTSEKMSGLLSSTVEWQRRKDTIKVSDSDKEAFVTALRTGSRVQLGFPVFGQLNGIVIQSRKQGETRAIVDRVLKEQEDGTISTGVSYTHRIRAMLLAAQVVHYLGQDFAGLEEPLNPVVSGGEEQPPGWLANADYWYNKEEAYQAVALDALMDFEVKYWMMVESSKDQNFWGPAEST